MNKIPKPNKKNKKQVIPNVKAFNCNDDGIVFSFEALENTEYFNLDGTCPNWAFDMLNMCKAISGISVKELTSGYYKTFRFHSHEGAKCPSPLPEGVELKDMYQLRISSEPTPKS